MPRLNIAQCLKLKNRLVQLYTTTFQRFESCNSMVETRFNRTEAESLWDRIALINAALIDLKVSISGATIPVRKDIFGLSELKGLAVKLPSINTFSGEKEKGYNLDKTEKHLAFLDEKAMLFLIKTVRNKIDEAQDRLDIFNATTFIEVPNETMKLFE